MTKAELIEAVSQRTPDLTRKQVELVVNLFFESIKHALASGDKVEIRGFGSFRLRRRGHRMGRNPRTGELVEVPAKYVPFFRAGKELRLLVDGRGSTRTGRAQRGRARS